MQEEIVDAIGDALSEVAPEVRKAMVRHKGFKDIGARMLLTWNDAMNGLRDARVYSLSQWKPGVAFEGLDKPAKLSAPKRVIGRSEGPANRSKKSKKSKRKKSR